MHVYCRNDDLEIVSAFSFFLIFYLFFASLLSNGNFYSQFVRLQCENYTELQSCLFFAKISNMLLTQNLTKAGTDGATSLNLPILPSQEREGGVLIT